MKVFLLIVGILLILFGLLISLGVALEILEGTSEDPVSVDITLLVLFGVGPIAGGLFLCWWALKKIGGSRTATRSKANDKTMNNEGQTFEEKTRTVEPVRQEEAHIERASNFKRFLTFVIDQVAVIVFYLLLGFLLGVILAILDEINRISNPNAIFLIVEKIPDLVYWILSFFIYYVFSEALFTRTLGKFITGTAVRTEDDGKPSFSRILLRTLCRFIPWDPLSFIAISHLTSVWILGERAYLLGISLHDSLSKTKVVDLRTKSIHASQKYSGLGIASFVIALVGLIIMFVFALINPEDPQPEVIESTIAEILFFSEILFNLVGIGLGTAGVVQKKRKKKFSILGLIFNIVLFLYLVFMVVANVSPKITFE